MPLPLDPAAVKIGRRLHCDLAGRLPLTAAVDDTLRLDPIDPPELSRDRVPELPVAAPIDARRQLRELRAVPQQVKAMTTLALDGGMTPTVQPDRMVPVRCHASGGHSRCLLDIERATNRAGHADAPPCVLTGGAINVPRSGAAPANDVVNLHLRRMPSLTIGARSTVRQ